MAETTLWARSLGGAQNNKPEQCARRHCVAIALQGCNVCEGDAKASAVRSTARSDSKGKPLIGPTRRHFDQTRNAEAAWQSSIDGGLNYVWSKEG
jgi:hypothetical protein